MCALGAENNLRKKGAHFLPEGIITAARHYISETEGTP